MRQNETCNSVRHVACCVLLPQCNHGFSANNAAADTFHTEFQKFLQEENLKPDQINNADDSE
jgi:sulfite reductase beta subunit-like hemoprotein